MRIGLSLSRRTDRLAALLVAALVAFLPLRAAPPASGLALWLKADAGVTVNDSSQITQWADQSGQGNNLIGDWSWATSPSVLAEGANGLPAIAFNEYGSSFNVPGVAAGGSAAEMFVVVRREIDSSESGFLGVLSPNYWTSAYPGSNGHIYDYAGNQWTETGQLLQALDVWVIYNVSVSPAGKTLRLNGVTVSSQGPIDPDSISFPDNAPLGGYNGFKGAIAEVLVYNRILEAAEHVDVLDHLQQRYAVIQAPIPPGIPTIMTFFGGAWVKWEAGAAQQTAFTLERKGPGDVDFVSLASGLIQTGYFDPTVVAGENYLYRVKAINGLGAESNFSTMSAPVTFSPVLGSALPAAGQMELWLKADQGIVFENQNGEDRIVAWHDQSPHSRIAVQDWGSAPGLLAASPDLNGHPAVQFPGGSEGRYLSVGELYLPGPAAVPGEELFFVVRRPNVAADPQGGSFTDLLGYTSGGTLGYPASNGHLIDTAGGVRTDAGKPVQALDTYAIYSVSVGPQGKTVRLNGVKISEQTWANPVSLSTLPGSTTFNNPTYFDYNTYETNYFEVNLAEALVFSRPLSETEYGQTLAYLQQKYGLIQAPVAPTGLAVNSNFGGGVVLEWEPGAPQQVYFEVQRLGPGDADFTTLAHVSRAAYFDAAVVVGQTYQYRVRAVNGVGQTSAFTAPLTVNYASAAGVSPAGLQLWLRADRGLTLENREGVDRVVAWHDQSGQGRVAAPSWDTPPTVASTPDGFNGLPAVSFSEQTSMSLAVQGDLLSHADASENRVEAFFVIQRPQTGGNHLGGVFSNLLGDSYNDGYPYSTGNLIDSVGGRRTESGPPPIPLNEPLIYSVSASALGKSIWFNGVRHYQDTQLPENAGQLWFQDGISFGNFYRPNNGGYDDALLAEVIVYDRQLSAAERSGVIGYLQQKYGVIPTPAVPVSLGTSEFSLGVGLHWLSGPAQMANFEVQRKGAGDVDFVTVATGLNRPFYYDSDVTAGETYEYRVRAVNGVGEASAYGSPLSVVYAPGSGITPAGLQLWLRADRGVVLEPLAGVDRVSRWLDQSGRGNDAFGMAGYDGGYYQRGFPVYATSGINGLPAVDFTRYNVNGEDVRSGMNNNTFMPGPVPPAEYFIVLRKNPDEGEGGFGEIFSQDSGRYGDVAHGGVTETTGFYTTLANPGVDVHQYNVFGVSVNTVAKTLRFNGIEVQTRASPQEFGYQRSGYYLGYTLLYGGDGRYSVDFGGQIAELIGYNRELTAVERIEVMAYLQQKYSIVPLPATPVNLTTDVLLAGGIGLHWNSGALQQTLFAIERDDGNGYLTIASVSGNNYTDFDATSGGTYHYRIRAVNVLGQSSPSSVAATVVYNPQVAAIPVNGLGLWLRSDRGLDTEVVEGDTRIRSWQDQSGRNRNAVAPGDSRRPTLRSDQFNGLAGVEFDYNNRFDLPDLLSGGTVPPAGELFIVVRGTGYYGSLYPGHSGLLDSSTFRDNFYSDMEALVAPRASQSEPYFYNVAGAEHFQSAWINGIRRYFSTESSVAGLTAAEGYLGAAYSYGGGNLNGSLAEVIYFQRILTEAERAQVLDYLQARYAAIPLPSAPANLGASQAAAATRVLLTWTPVPNQEVVYEIQRKMDAAPSFSIVATGVEESGWSDPSVASGHSYTYRIIARNGVGDASPVSNEASLTIAAPQPAVATAGLKTWYRADQGVVLLDGNKVVRWFDQSEFANDAVVPGVNYPSQLPNQINGQPAISFDSGSLRLQPMLVGATAGEYFLITRVPSNGPIALHPNHGLVVRANTPDTVDSFLSADYHYFPSGVPNNAWVLYSGRAESEAWSAAVNNSVRHTIANNVFANPSVADEPLTFNYGGGMVAELLVYDRVLSPAERTAVANYLQSRYAVIPSPNAPNSLVAYVPLLRAQVELRWQAVGTQAIDFEIQRQAAGEPDFTSVATGVRTVTYIDTTVQPGITYQYRVRAVNGVGAASGFSNLASIAVPPPETELPVTTGVRLWLRADAGLSVDGSGNILEWRDQGGAGNKGTTVARNASQNARVNPTAINGRPAVHFNLREGFNFGTLFQGMNAAEIFVYHNKTSPLTGTDLSLANSYGRSLWGYSTRYPHTDGKIHDSVGVSQSLGEVSFVPTESIFGFHLYNVSASPTDWYARINGIQQHHTAQTQASFPFNAVLGADNFANVACLGDIAEVLVYDRVLTLAERQQVETYFLNRYSDVLQAPVFSPAPGRYANSVNVSLSTASPDAQIYYTLNGASPDPATSPAYTGPIAISGESALITALSAKGGELSSVVSGLYSIGVPPGTENGLSGLAVTYYRNADFTGGTVKRRDPLLQFPRSISNFPYSVTLPADIGSAIWTGSLVAQFSENYTLYVQSDGKPKLWIGDTLVLDGSDQTGFGELSATLHLVAGQSYPIRVEYVLRSPGSTSERISLSWSSLSIAREVIPARQLLSNLPYGDTLATPVATPAAGTFADSVSIALSVAGTPAAKIYYTLDGSEPGATSTLYTTPITAQQSLTLKARAYLANYNDSGLRIAAYALDNAGPVLSDPRFNGAAVPSPISTDGEFSVTATDNSGVKRVEFRLDGQLLGTDLYGGDGFRAPFDVRSVTDGAHVLTIQAWDTVNVPSEVMTVNIDVALPRPPAPTITFPTDGVRYNRAPLTVRGQAEPGATVVLYQDGVSAGTAAAGADGAFAIDAVLGAGVNEFTATAKNRNPVPSTPSATVHATYDNTVPGAPNMLTARSRSGGRIQLDWHAPTAGLTSGYYVFRSTSAIPENTTFSPSGSLSGLQTATSYTDTPPADGKYYYRVVAGLNVGADVTMSTPSNQVDAASDRTGPTATIALQPMGPLFDAAGHRYGVGLVKATLTISEPLAAAPFFNITTAGGFPIAVDLAADGGNTYSGIVNITASTASGPAGASFSAYDAAGNRGTEATFTTPLVIDTAGPVATGFTPVAVDGGGQMTDLPERDVVKNDAPAPLSWRFTFDEPPKPSTTPAFTATLSGHPGLAVPVTVTDAGDADARTWLVTLTLPAEAGAETENLTLGFSATDDLDNVGQTIVPPHVVQVYQGALPPLAVPANLAAEARPAGVVHLHWSGVDGAAAYVLQVKAPGAPDFADLLVLTAVEFEHTYTPDVDGEHAYRVASVRSANGQESTSGWSNVATARADRVPPDAPQSLALEVIAQGVKATWTAPAGGLADVAGYSLYRNGTAIADIGGLTPAIAVISKNAVLAVDAQPAGTLPYYALVAFDAAGNRSAPATAFANVGLLPVRTLGVSRVDAGAPVLAWTPAPGSVIDGYNLLIDGAIAAVNGAELIPVATQAYTDASYTAGDRTYAIRAVSGGSSRERSLLLPDVTFALAAGAEIKRGLMNVVTVHVENRSAADLLDNVVKLRVAGRDHYAATPFDLAAGASADVPVVVGGYEDLPSGAVTTEVSFTTNPADGETVSLVRHLPATVAEGALTVEVVPGEFTRGGTGRARFRLTNPSALPIEFVVARGNGSQPSDQVRLKLLDPQQALLSTTAVRIALGDNVVALPNGSTVVRVPAGGTYTSPQITLPVPLSAPSDILVALEIDWVYSAYGQPNQVTLKGPRAQQAASTRQTSYTAELTSVTPADSNGDVPVVVSGRTLWRGLDPALPSAAAPNSPVIVYLALDGFLRQQALVSDAAGNFTWTFEPGPTEKGGVYQVWASHPDVSSPPDTPDSFTIRRVLVSPQVFNYRAPRNYGQALPVTVTTGKGTSVQNLRAELVGSLPEAVTFTTTPLAAVAPNQSVTLPLSVVGTAATPTSVDSGTLQFRVVSDDGAGGQFLWATLTVNYVFTTATPYLQATPNLIQIGVQPGQTASDTLVLKNNGYAALEGAALGLVSANATPLPAWIRLQTAAALGTIDVGQTREVAVSAAPPADAVTVDTIYFGYVRVTGANGTPQDFPVNVTVSPSGQGDALLKIIDPYFQLPLPNGAVNPSFNGLVGASVVLEKESSTGIATLTQSRQSDANGEVAFTDLPAGRYKLRINADRHEPYTGRITIKPGVTYAEQIALTYNPVTFTWEVVPVTFQDRYDIVLTSTFETNVPMPVLVVEPGSVSLPNLCAGQVFSGEFRITNHGLIDAEEVQLPLPKSDEYFSYEFLSSFGDRIRAGRTVTIAYRIKCLKPLPGTCAETVASTQAALPFGQLLASHASQGAGLALGMGGSVAGNAACGTYGTAVEWVAIGRCANGITVPVKAVVYFAKPFGECGGTPPPGPGSAPPPWSGGGGGIIVQTGNGGGGGIVGSSTPVSDECYPDPRLDPPFNPPALPKEPNNHKPDDGGRKGGGGNNPQGPGDPGERCKPGEQQSCPDGDSCSPKVDHVHSLAGSWVNLVTRQFRDTSVDLSIAVQGGSVDVSRDYNHRRWSFLMNDDIFALCAADGSACSLMLKEASFRPAGTANSATVTAIQPASAVPAGVYLLAGAGPESITKLPDGTFVWTDGTGGERRYNASGRLTSTWLQGVLFATYVYDGGNHLSAITDHDGRTVLTFTYTGENLTGASDWSGRSVSYGYDSQGRLVSYTDALGTTTTYAYDGWWHLTGKREHIVNTAAEADHVETIEYRLFATTEAPSAPPVRVVPGHPTLAPRNRAMVAKVSHNTGESFTYAFQYNEGSKTYYAYRASSTGRIEESLFDSSANLISKSVNGEVALKVEQDAHTRVTTRAGNLRTTDEFDDRARLVRRIHPDGSVERNEYDDTLNVVKRHTARSGLVTAYTYDSMRNVLTLTEAVGTPLERMTAYEYYPDTSLRKQETKPDGYKIGYEYNADGYLTREFDVADPLRQTVHTYDARGLVASTTDANGNVTSYSYDSEQRPVEITNPLGEKTINTYQGDHLVQVETGRVGSSLGRIVRYAYDSQGRRLAVKRVDSAGIEHVVITYAYDTDGRMISETNALGQAITYRYDAAGNRTVVSAPTADGGRAETVTTYDGFGRPIETRDPLGVRTITAYDAAGRVASVTEVAGTALARTTTNSYDPVGRIIETKLTDVANPAVAYTTTRTYDLLGRVLATGGNRVYATTTTYDVADRVLTSTDALGRITFNEYDAEGQLIAVRINGQLVGSSTYDRLGNRLSAADGVGNHRHYHYDALGRLTHESIPLPAAEIMPEEWWMQPAYVLQEVVYDRFGQQTATKRYTVDGTGTQVAVSSMTYDDFGRLLTETDPAGFTRTYSYDAADNVVQILYPPVISSGQQVASTETFLRSPHNAALVDATVDRAGNATHFVYDVGGRVVQETNSLGGATQRTYDALGRVTAQTDPANATALFEYNSFGQPVKITHPDHVPGTHERIETFRYDTYGKLVEKGGAGEYPVTYTYDAVGNMLTLTDGNNHTTRWTYTSLNQVNTKTYADGTSHAYTYDLAGRLKTRRDALNRTTTYGYSSYGLLVSVDYPTDVDVAYAYDQQGRRLSMSDGSGTTTWGYDGIGRPLTETQGRSHRTLTYGYDQQNLRTSLVVTSSDAGLAPWTTSYGYDNAGRLLNVRDDRLAVGAPYTYTYATNANVVASITTPTGLKTLKSYDNLGRLLSTTGQTATAGIINSFVYTYDAAGQRSSEIASTGKRDFTYDAWRQLTTAVKSVSGVETDRHTYTFDSIGNRLEVGRVVPDEPAATTAYTANEVNQYTAIMGAQADTPSYDLNGNTISLRGFTLRYDEENRLVEASNATRRDVYIYDAIGRRMEKRDYAWNGAWNLTSIHRYVYDGWRVIEDWVASSDVQPFSLYASYTRGTDLSGSFEDAGGIGGLLAMSVPSGSLFTTASYFYDGNGNITQLAFDDGASAAQYTYTAFGEREAAAGVWSDLNLYQFGSKECDGVTGFYYFGYRFYDAAAGRWLSRDPIGEEGGLNLFGMVANSPTNATDPLGLDGTWGFDGMMGSGRSSGPQYYQPNLPAWLTDFAERIGALFDNDKEYRSLLEFSRGTSLSCYCSFEKQSGTPAFSSGLESWFRYKEWNLSKPFMLAAFDGLQRTNYDMLPGGVNPMEGVPNAPDFSTEATKREFRKRNRQMFDKGFHKDAWVQYQSENFAVQMVQKKERGAAAADAASIAAALTDNIAREAGAGLRIKYDKQRKCWYAIETNSGVARMALPPSSGRDRLKEYFTWANIPLPNGL